MNKKVIITIGREFGSCGREIGERLSKKLGIEFYDRNILELAAKKSGMSAEYLAPQDEKAANPLLELTLPSGINTGTLSEKLFIMQSQIIQEKAAQESCIIVGRCANEILKEKENLIRVFIFAPIEFRISNVMKYHDLDNTQDAVKAIKRADKIRRTYHQYYTDAEWGDKTGYDLLINSSSSGVDGAVELIIQYLKIKGYE